VPNKTIYVAEKDLRLFERAQEIAGGNLSAAISNALNDYVQRHGAVDDGHGEVTVSVGQAGMRRKKRFIGTPIARWQGKSRSDKSIVERHIVYRTAKGRYAVHTRRDWSPVPLPFDLEYDVGIPSLQSDQRTRSYTLDVYDSLDELKKNAPPELAELIDDSSAPDLEELDI
jgi:EXLDI family protein